MRDKLIVTLVLHPEFGYMLQPLLASYLPHAKVYSIAGAARTDAESFSQLTEKERILVQLAERCSNKELMKSFSKEKNETDFLRKVTPKDIDLYIRPFIEKQHAKMALIMRELRVPFFFREKVGVRDFRESQEIEVLQTPSEMVFRFKRADTFTYGATVRNGDSDVTLYDQFFAPLASSPALAVVGRQLHYFTDVDEKKLRPFFSKDIIEVPERNVPAYIRTFVVQCVKNYNVESEGLRIVQLKYAPVAVLTLEPDFYQKPTINLSFHYGSHQFSAEGSGKKEVEVIDKDGVLSIGWFYRDREWEKSRMAMLRNAGLSHARTGLFVLTSDDKSVKTQSMGSEKAIQQEETPASLVIIEWINANGELLKNFELRQSLGKVRYYTGEIDLKISVDEGNDWFDIHCIACFGDVRIPFIQFKDHILNGDREYVLPDGSIAVLPKEWFSRFDEMFRFGKVSADKVTLRRHHFRVKELVEVGSVTKFDSFDGSAFQDIMRDDELVPVPETLNASLRPYQEKGFQWLARLRKNGFGGCLADDMGLGKTLQTIALLLHAYANASPTSAQPLSNGSPRQLSLFEELPPRQESSLPPSLVVMPTSLIHNWMNELSKFAPSLSVYAHTGSNHLRPEQFKQKAAQCHVILTTYGIVRSDIDLLRDYAFHYIILDESHYIKNPASQIFDCVTQLRSDHKLVLTGTPVENSLSDLWAQMDFINSGILGKLSDFKAYFKETDVVRDDEARLRLLQIINPFILRRTKEDVAPELPPLTEEVLYCEMEEEQALLYNEEKNKIRNILLEQLSDSDKTYSAAALSSLMRLRLLANHPAISMPEYSGCSAKFEQIMEQAQMVFAGGHKVLIFSSFVKHLRLLAHYFDMQGWKYAWLTGNTSDRKGEIEKFNTAEEVKTFFISLKAGGTGLNLTAADYVFIIDPWWNPAAELQAVSRAHRIGQQRNVTLYRFIVKGTVEEKIQRMQQHKSSLAEAVVSSQLSMEDIKELLDVDVEE